MPRNMGPEMLHTKSTVDKARKSHECTVLVFSVITAESRMLIILKKLNVGYTSPDLTSLRFYVRETSKHEVCARPVGTTLN
jgi:hypothetical protein